MKLGSSIRPRLSLAVPLAAALLVLAAPRAAHAQAWLDPAWAHRRPVSVANPAGVPLTDHEVRIDLGAGFDFTSARPDGGDLRVAIDGDTEIPFWIETWEPAQSRAVLWARLPALPPAGAVVHVYYGNPVATGTGDARATFHFYEGFESHNATEPLVTPTYDGSGQAMHPGLVYIPGGWNGYEYWMANTPFPFDFDPLENPCLLASHDGLTWVVPPGLVNPLAPGYTGGYNNDTDLLYVNGKLVCYYNETFTSGTTNIRRMESSDGVHWTAPFTVITFQNFEMSPTIVVDGGVYKMWYVASALGCYAPQQGVYLRTSADGFSWSDPVTVSFDNPGIVVWHPDVKKDGSKYVMLSSCYDAGATCFTNNLYYAESTDGLHWTFVPQPIIGRTAGGWDDLAIYRTSFLIQDGFMRIWYSASSSMHVWGIGYVEGTLPYFLSSVGRPWDFAQGPMQIVDTRARHGERSLRQDGHATKYPMLSRFRGGRYAVSAWLYDDLSDVPSLGADLRIWDPGNSSFALHCVGVGLMTSEDPDHYAYFTEDWVYTSTSIPRSAGWHRLTVAVADATIRLSLDDTLVGSLDVLDENAIERFSLEGDVMGSAWFDDVYVRSYVEPEPATTVGARQDTSSTLAVGPGAPGGMSLSYARPSPFGVATTLVLTLSRPGHVDAAIYAVDGRRVRTLARGERGIGAHALVWDGRDDDGRSAAPGIYYARVRTDRGDLGRKVVLSR